MQPPAQKLTRDIIVFYQKRAGKSRVKPIRPAGQEMQLTAVALSIVAATIYVELAGASPCGDVQKDTYGSRRQQHAGSACADEWQRDTLGGQDDGNHADVKSGLDPDCQDNAGGEKPAKGVATPYHHR